MPDADSNQSRRPVTHQPGMLSSPAWLQNQTAVPSGGTKAKAQVVQFDGKENSPLAWRITSTTVAPKKMNSCSHGLRWKCILKVKMLLTSRAHRLQWKIQRTLRERRMAVNQRQGWSERLPQSLETWEPLSRTSEEYGC